ncbi:MAG: methylated-DNA--[protein]-cysteine S-methyltransferase [Actinobacteria bacterium]|nr:methylated-DNA--[protein]-cysteine S-methyltransferase [Actinomycetota bacterium]
MTVSTDLDRRFREAAGRAGLLDAGYDVVDSEIGPLLVAVSDRGLLRISFDSEADHHLEWIARLAGPGVLRTPRAVDAVRRELDEYFAGKRQAFDLSVDLRGQAAFTIRVLDELAQVPFGETATYAELARRAGNPKAARAVGMVMNKNPIPIVLPCHRIVGANGSLTGYAGGLDVKERLLRHEGVVL